MKKYTIIWLLFMTVLSSCVRDEIHTVRNSYHINYIINDSVLYCKPKDVEIMWLRFYDVETNKRTREVYVYPTGTDIDLQPGYHTIVAYNHENAATNVTYPEDLSILTAETETLTETPYRIIAAPSHLYVGVMKKTYIPYVAESEPIYNINLEMSSPMDSWRTIITGVQNLDYCRSITLYVTNQYEDILLGDMTREGCAVLSSSGYISSDYKNVMVDFATFGMVPGKNIEMQIYLTDASGASYRIPEGVKNAHMIFATCFISVIIFDLIMDTVLEPFMLREERARAELAALARSGKLKYSYILIILHIRKHNPSGIVVSERW